MTSVLQTCTQTQGCTFLPLIASLSLTCTEERNEIAASPLSTVIDPGNSMTVCHARIILHGYQGRMEGSSSVVAGIKALITTE